jgi:hypothetical protein
MFNKQYLKIQHLTPLSLGEGLGVRRKNNQYSINNVQIKTIH